MYQFKYCPLVWMMHGRKLNNRINKIRERALRVTCNDNHFTLSDYDLFFCNLYFPF